MIEELNLRDYIDATSDASKRTRVIMISIVVASVLVFAGCLNSFESSWTLQRLRAVSKDPKRNYFNHKFPWIVEEQSKGKSNSDSPDFTIGSTKETPQLTTKEEQYKMFLSALTESYVNTSYVVRVPFFGINFDVNDLGVIGGLALLILLVLYRFSLSRELDNLELSFDQVRTPKDLPTFYHLLAMRQVLIVPPTKQKNQEPETGKVLRKLPKFLPLLPVIVLSIIMVNDVTTIYYGSDIGPIHTIISLLFTVGLLSFLIVTSVGCLRVWNHMEQVWLNSWDKICKDVNDKDSQPRARNEKK